MSKIRLQMIVDQKDPPVEGTNVKELGKCFGCTLQGGGVIG